MVVWFRWVEECLESLTVLVAGSHNKPSNLHRSIGNDLQRNKLAPLNRSRWGRCKPMCWKIFGSLVHFCSTLFVYACINPSNTQYAYRNEMRYDVTFKVILFISKIVNNSRYYFSIPCDYSGCGDILLGIMKSTVVTHTYHFFFNFRLPWYVPGQSS